MADNSPYTHQSVSGFNSSPPSDDGVQSASNALRWSNHISKIGTPLKTAIEAIDAELQTAFSEILPEWRTDQTSEESSEGVTPTNYQYPPGNPFRYGAAGDGATDDTAALQACIDVCIAAGIVMDLVGIAASDYLISSPLSITGALKILGHGYGTSGIITDECNAFDIAAGLIDVDLQGFRINSAVRHTDTPNTLIGINIQGTTASPATWFVLRDLFIDGFATYIQADGLRESLIDNVIGVFGKNGILADEQTVNNVVSNCVLAGSGSGSYGVNVGDGSAATEGWIVKDCVLFGFSAGVRGYGASNSFVRGCLIDFFSEYGVIVQSGGSLAATNWNISDNYIAGTGTASTGIRLLSDVASSDPRGTRISGNDILVYSGSTLTYGILIDGTEEVSNIISGNSVSASTMDCNIQAGSGHIVVGNNWRGLGFNTVVVTEYGNNLGTIISSQVVLKNTVGARTRYYAAAMPASGSYTAGDFVENTAPAIDGSNLVIMGWVRLTTGSSHSSGTDWAIARVSHVSPAT